LPIKTICCGFFLSSATSQLIIILYSTDELSATLNPAEASDEVYPTPALIDQLVEQKSSSNASGSVSSSANVVASNSNAQVVPVTEKNEETKKSEIQTFSSSKTANPTTYQGKYTIYRMKDLCIDFNNNALITFF
jgi:hypothetical protein